MANIKSPILLALVWLASLAGVFWLGQRWRPAVDTAAPAPAPVAPAPAVIPPEPEPPIPEPVPAARPAAEVIAEAAAQVRGGLVSQKKVLEVFARMREIDQGSLAEALAAVGALEAGSAASDVLVLALLGRWAEFDGGAAMRHAEEELEGALRLGVVTNVAASWAESDPDAALAWYRDRASSGEFARLFGSGAAAADLLAPMFRTLAERSPDAALAELEVMEGGHEYRAALGGVASAMVAAGKGELLLARIELFPEERRGEAKRVTVRHWAGLMPAEAAAWVARLPASSERASFAKEVGLQWVRREPLRAMRWMMQNTPPEHHPAHLAEATAIWARSDPNATAEWLAGLAPGPAADPAIAAFARQVVRRDPESAFAWAATIGDVTMRKQATESVFAQWAIREPAAAREFLETAELTEAEQAALDSLVPGAGERD